MLKEFLERQNRNDAFSGSSVAAVKRLPNSERNGSPLKFIGPRVSMASGTNIYIYIYIYIYILQDNF